MAFLSLTVLLVTFAKVAADAPCVEFVELANLKMPNWKATEFTVDIEIVSGETGRITQNQMYYSKEQNIIRLSTLERGTTTDLYFLFSSQEILGFDYSKGRGKCTVRSMQSSADLMLVGGPEAMLNPLNAIHFLGSSGFGDNKIQHNYQSGNGPLKIRGLPAEAYKSCQKWSFQSMDATLMVTHYFSDVSIPNKFTYPYDQVIPLMITVEGIGSFKNSQNVSIKHTYSFFNYKNTFDQTALETPPGIYCEGRETTPLPKTSSYIRMSTETVGAMGVEMAELVLDETNQVAIYKTQPYEFENSNKFLDRKISLRDYTTGLAFQLYEDCEIVPISEVPKIFEGERSDGTYYMLTADQFFFNNNKYQYVGKRQARGMNCDVYMTYTKTRGGESNMTFEVYFAPKTVSTWNDQVPSVASGGIQMPVMNRFWLGENDLNGTVISLFHTDFSTMPYKTLDVDLRLCFKETASNFLTVILNDKKDDIFPTDFDLFKWHVRQALAEAANVAWWRITDLRVYFEEKDVLVDFEILDAPAVQGSVHNIVKQPSLQDAVSNLSKKVNAGRLKVNVKNVSKTGQTKTKELLFRKELRNRHLPKNDNGYGSDAMAGLGVGMLLVGALTGGAATAYFTR